jgi:acyl carrier protein
MQDGASEIKGFILRELLPNESPDRLTADTPLVSSGIVDSLAILRLIAFIEEQFGVQVEAHEATRDNFENISCMVAMVNEKRAAK